MADYYPLLAKAVSGLKSSTPESRHAIYERARKALLGQLRAMQPPAPEAAIEREAQALDEAITRLEREFFLFPPVSQTEEPAPGPSAQELVSPPVPPPVPESLASESDENKSADDNAAQEAAQDAPEGAAAPTPRENLRPAAPKPETREGGGWRRLIIVLSALIVVLAMVGFAAWKLRDRPEDLARMAPAPESSEQKSGGKIAERVGSDGGAATSNGSSGAGAPVLPIGYRAAVLMQAPSEPGGVKTFTGTVVWRRDSSNRGPNQQLSSAIRADIDLPDAHFKMSMVIEKNYEAALSVSHTITVHFEPAEDSPIGSVKAINMPEMRRDDAPKGTALYGLPVDIAPNIFLVGLASTSESQNLDLLSGMSWFDIPMNLAVGRVAKATFEKGPAGEKIFADVLAEWKAQ
jgi:hypothetical protein